jgi:ankyrin repeat protein
LWTRQRLRVERVVETSFAAIASLRAAPAPSRRPVAELSPLGAANKDDDLQKASELLASGADPNAVSQFRTPLEQALIHKNREMIRLLIEHGADLRALNTSARSPLQDASERDPELGAWLFQQLPDPTVLDAAEAGTLDHLRKLVDAGGDVNTVSPDSRCLSPLQAAALRGDVEIARFLLERGADVSYRGEWDRPAVVIAATSTYSVGMTELLLSRGADPNVTDHNGQSLLYELATTYPVDVLETLIRAGAIVNFRAPDGSTPLHHAASGNTDPKARAIHALVQHGAELDAQDNQGFTPLHAALERTMSTAAQTLLDLGADPTIRDHEGRTPVELIGGGVKQYPGIPEVIRRIDEWVRPKE